MTVTSLAAGADRLARCSAWIRAWTPAVLLRWCWRHRVLTTAMLAGLVLLVVGAAAATADPGTGADSGGGGDVLISWMGIKDSDNVPVAKYTLTLNQGGWDDPVSKACATIASISYEIYLCVTTTALWLIHFVLDFEWLKLFTGPFQTIGRGVDTAMERFGLGATALAILAIIVVCTVLAGRIAKAMSNIAMGLLMVGLAATIFANPLSQLVGPDGLLAKGRDTGLQIATSVSDGAMTDQGGKADVDDMVKRLADRFLRKPTQMINFGEVSDSVSRKCRQAWSKGIQNGRGDKLKDDIEGCDSKKGPAMHQKSMGSPASVLVPLNICGLLAIFLVAFACYFVWHVVRAAVQAMLYAALAPPAFAIGVIPGGPQTFAWKTILDCAMAFAAMIIYTAAFGAYNVILDQVFKESNAIKSIFMTALVLAFGFAFFGPLRRMFDRHRDTMAAKLGGGAGRSGRGWLSKTADLARIKQELAPQFGWRHGAGGARRAPGRIEPESDSSSSSGGGPGGGGGGDGDPPPGPVSVSDPAAGSGSGGQVSAGAGSEAETTPAAAADRQRAPQPDDAVLVTDIDRSRVRERLAEAIRISRAGLGGGVGASGGGRHALSEVA